MLRAVQQRRPEGKNASENRAAVLCNPPYSSYTNSMKTAISIPDKIFKRAERLARRLGISRSHLYRLAVEDYVEKQRPGSITDAMNRVVDEVEARGDEFVSSAAQRVLARTEW